MFKGIVNTIREANESVRKGDAYRLEKYGPPETFSENLKRSRKIYSDYRENNIPKCRSMFETSSQTKEIENFKMKFHYWDEWTGGRFARRENPYMKMSDTEWHRSMGLVRRPNIEMKTICRSNPVTGYWEALNEQEYH